MGDELWLRTNVSRVSGVLECSIRQEPLIARDERAIRGLFEGCLAALADCMRAAAEKQGQHLERRIKDPSSGRQKGTVKAESTSGGIEKRAELP